MFSVVSALHSGEIGEEQKSSCQASQDTEKGKHRHLLGSLLSTLIHSLTPAHEMVQPRFRGYSLPSFNLMGKTSLSCSEVCLLGSSRSCHRTSLTPLCCSVGSVGDAIGGISTCLGEGSLDENGGLSDREGALGR